MNLEETIYLSQLTEEQKKKLKFWCPDMSKHVLVFPKKIFCFVTKNIPIVDSEKKPIVFSNKEDARNMIQKFRNQTKS